MIANHMIKDLINNIQTGKHKWEEDPLSNPCFMIPMFLPALKQWKNKTRRLEE